MRMQPSCALDLANIDLGAAPLRVVLDYAICPASSSSQLKAFPLHLRHSEFEILHNCKDNGFFYPQAQFRP
jgi:hypothetical protein